MCRFVMYKGEPMSLDTLVLKPKNSLVNQSLESRMGATRVNGDGFGIAWYAPHVSTEPGLFRCVSPAWNDSNLTHVARFVRSSCILAHVRAASTGSSVGFANCHPFVAGRYSFMHNGELAGFNRIRRKVLDSLSDEAFDRVEGSTDSEHIFAVFLDRMVREPENTPRETMAAALLHAVRDLLRMAKEAGNRDPSYLNIVVADGHEAVALRYTSGKPQSALSCFYHEGERYVCEGDSCRMIRPDVGKGALLVSSEPLSSDPGWDPLPPNHMLLVGPDARPVIEKVPRLH